jgi:hypothetical protein
MSVPKYRIKIGRKETDHSIEENTMVLYNEIFNPRNGVAIFEIERDKWDVLSYEQFTGLTDMDGEEIYEGDVLVSEQFPDDIEFKVRAEAGGFVINTPVRAWVHDKYPWTALADEQTQSWVRTTCKIKKHE